MSESTVHTDISRLLDILKATGKKYDLEKITGAFEYARDLHEGQFRVSGEAYISHPIAVAEIVALKFRGIHQQDLSLLWQLSRREFFYR